MKTDCLDLTFFHISQKTHKPMQFGYVLIGHKDALDIATFDT